MEKGVGGGRGGARHSPSSGKLSEAVLENAGKTDASPAATSNPKGGKPSNTPGVIPPVSTPATISETTLAGAPSKKSYPARGASNAASSRGAARQTRGRGVAKGGSTLAPGSSGVPEISPT